MTGKDMVPYAPKQDEVQQEAHMNISFKDGAIYARATLPIAEDVAKFINLLVAASENYFGGSIEFGPDEDEQAPENEASTTDE